MAHLFALWFVSKPTCSVLAKSLHWTPWPSIGKAGKKGNRHLSDFLPFLLCLHAGKNPPACSHALPSLYHLLDKGSHEARGAWGLAQGGAMAGEHVHNYLSVCARKKGAGTACRAHLQRSLNGTCGRLGKHGLEKKYVEPNNSSKCKIKSSQDLYNLPVTDYPGLPHSYLAILFSWYKLHSSKLVWSNTNHIYPHTHPYSKRLKSIF